jgi:hypothetical protein
MRRQEKNYNVSSGEVGLNFTLLANIFSFVRENLTQEGCREAKKSRF